MPIKNIIKNIINHHNKVEEEQHHYWLHKLEKFGGFKSIPSHALASPAHENQGFSRCQSPSEDGNRHVTQIINSLNHLDHHIGDFYRKFGMGINLGDSSKKAADLLQVMGFITNGLVNEENVDIRPIVDEEDVDDLEKMPNLTHKNALDKYRQLYGRKNRKQRLLFAMDLPEEIEIKAIAISILAETNGNVQMAHDILSVAGLKIIKSMSHTELRHLKADLQALSTETDDEFIFAK
jgi:hypothetical protein